MTMLLMLCACSGNKKAIEKQLQGDWKDSRIGVSILRFDNGKLTSITGKDARHGTYKIADGKIHLVYDNGIEADLEYTFENNELDLKFYQKIN